MTQDERERAEFWRNRSGRKQSDDEKSDDSGGPLRLFRRIRQLIVDVAIISVVVGIVAAIGPSVMKPSVVIDSINMPLALEERGYSSDVVARRLRDELRNIQTIARPTILTSLNLTDVAAEQRLPDIEAPGGLTLRWFVTMIREFLNLEDVHISGELTVDKKPGTSALQAKSIDDEETVEPPPTYALRLRSRNTGPLHQSAEPSEVLQDIFQAAAVSILEVSNPVLAGRYCEVSRKYDDAERVARTLIGSGKDAEVAQGLILRGNIFVCKGSYDQAIADFERVLAKNPQSSIAAVNVAWANYRAGRYEAVIAAADRAIAINPSAASAYAHKANALRFSGRAREAVQVALAGEHLEPNNGQPLVALAGAYNALRRPQEGLDAAQRAIQRDPNYGSSYIALGFSLQFLDRIPESLNAFKRGMEIDPTWAVGWIGYGSALRRANRLPEALDAFSKAVEIEPDSGEFQFERGNTLFAMKKYADALKSFERLSRTDYKPSLIALSLARCHLELKNLPKALLEFARSAERQPTNAAAWREWSEALLRLKRYSDAIGVLTKARERLPQDAILAKLMGEAHQGKKDEIKAREAYEAAMALDPGLRSKLEPVLEKLRKKPPVVVSQASR